MAREFNGTSHFLASAAALAGLSGKDRIAFSFWVYATFNADDDMLLELSANAGSNAGTFWVLGNESGTNTTWVNLRGNTGLAGEAIADGVISDGAWHHVLVNGVFSNGNTTEVESIYLDGVLLTTAASGTNENTATFGSYTLYVMSRAGTSLFADGRMADLCIWTPTTAISGTDAAALAAGARANSVRSSDIAHYWPLEGTASPEPGVVGGIDLNVTGATFVADPPTLDPYGEVYDPIDLDVMRTTSTTATLTWTPDDGPDGMSILRAPAAHTTDGSGDAYGAPGYDPATIAGATMISTGETSPYVDTGLDAGTDYTYAVIRTGA
jgi:hypothetical protein